MKIDLNTLSGGAVAEKINRELQKVAENVLDPNTKADAVRTLTVTIKIKPDASRQIGMTDIQVKSSLVPSSGVPAKFIFDYTKDGKAVMAEMLSYDINQAAIDNEGDVVDYSDKKVINGNFR